MIENCTRHSKIAGNRCHCLSGVNESTGIADVAVGDQLRPPTEILTGLAALSDGVGNTLALDVDFRIASRTAALPLAKPYRRWSTQTVRRMTGLLISESGAAPHFYRRRPHCAESRLARNGTHVRSTFLRIFCGTLRNAQA